MDDPLLARRIQSVRNLRGDLQRLPGGEGALREALRERRSVHQFQHEGCCACTVLDPVDAADVWMIERGPGRALRA